MSTDWKGITGEKTDEDAAKYLHKLYRQGASSTDIAEVIGITDVTLRSLFRQFNLSIKPHGGQYKGFVKLDISEEEYKTMTYEQIAKRYDVSVWTVWNKTKKYRKKIRKKRK